MSTHRRAYRDLFVGRERELRELQHALDAALRGRGSLWLLAGEPGIGKTRATEELSRQAHARGALVLWGRCWEEEGAPVFWPWVQVIRTYLRDRETATLIARLGAAADSIAAAIPELRGAPSQPPEASPLDAPEGRFRFFDGVATLLKLAAAEQPLVLVLDDLHWADTPSVLLLRFVARTVGSERILLIGTLRAVDASVDGPRSAALADLAREGTRLDLRGLSEAELGALVAAAIDAPAPLGWVSALHRQTEGNPFFVHELLELLIVEDGMRRNVADLGVPLGVRQVIRGRVARLSAECQALLAMAAVVGRDFDTAVLQGLAAVEGQHGVASQLRQLLDEAVREDVVRVSRAVDRVAFTHALFRETLYEDVDSDTRARRHGRIADLLEPVWATDLESHLAELAHHFSRAPTPEARDKALHYMQRAGDRSARLLAYEDAAAHYEAALQVLARVGEGDVAPTLPSSRQLQLASENSELRPHLRHRCELLLAVGDMRKRAGDRQRASLAYGEAVELARRMGTADLLARGVVGMPLAFRPGMVDRELLPLLDEAVRILPSADSRLRVELLVRLTVELCFSAGSDRCVQISQEAVDMARRLADPATLALALNGRYWALWSPDRTTERVAVVGEMVGLAEQARDMERQVLAHSLRTMDCLELGDVDGADAAIAEVERLAQALRQPQFFWYALTFRTMRTLLDGRFADAERLAAEALHVGLEQNPNAPLVYGAQMLVCRLAQDRVGELEAVIDLLARQAPELAVWRCTRALIHSQTGRTAEAQAELERLAGDDFSALRRDGSWLQAMAQLATVCVACGSVTAAAKLYEQLLPYADRNVLIGAAAACAGSVSHWLGELAALLARWDEARDHFEAAMRRHEQMGARALLAYSRHAYGQMLFRCGRPADAEHARKLLESAAQTYRALELPSFTVRVERMLRDHSVAVSASAAPHLQPAAAAAGLSSGSTEAANILRREGDFWTIVYSGSVARLKDAKGIRYLAQLLRDPGRDFHVADLVRAVEGVPEDVVVRARRMQGKDLAADGVTPAVSREAKLLPDARAVGEYRRRLEGLRDDLDEAERFNDVERAARARAEIDFLSGELGTAYGIGGARSAVAPVEKLRKAVGNRLRESLGRIQHVHPSLGRHLRTALKLGTFCSYCPDPPIRWDVQ